MEKERQHETQFTTKIGMKNQFGSQLFHFVKFPFTVTCLMPYYAKTDPSRPLYEQLTIFSTKEVYGLCRPQT